ncbi:unnamed protein product [Rotaria sp. Silwood1]|nr:unnamed protein product [Rotaria sp. Silwood1]CAF1614716.1 unnamed protein product [Rotaria sp. Silwood1]CAF3758559.1 unnamed protein product [Rotaria sp. Silwood1]
MLRTVLLSLILLVSLSSSSSILRKSLKRRQSDAPPCNAIEGFECKCSYFRVSCTTTREYPSPLKINENEKHKYQSVELVIGTAQDIHVNDRTFESVKELYKNDGDNYEFRIKFEKFTGLHLSSPGIFNRVFPDNIPQHARKQMALEIYNPEVAPSDNKHLFQNLNVDALELYALYPFHGTFQQLFDGANIKYLRLSGGEIRSDLSQSFTGTISRIELARQASALSVQNFPVYPAHELIINAFYITEFNTEHPPNYSNLGELRVFSPGRIPANAFQQFPNIHTLSISTDADIDPNALHGLNNLEKLSIKEPRPSLALLNSVPNIKEFETNIEKLDDDAQCQLVGKLANGQIAVQGIPNGRECTCINAYLSTAAGRTPCEPQGCERSSCATIKNNYDTSMRVFKPPPAIRRADGSDALHPREPRVYKSSYQVEAGDRDKLHRAIPPHHTSHTQQDDDSQKHHGSHDQSSWQQHEHRPDTHPSWPTSSDINHYVVTDDNQKSDSYGYPSGADNNQNENTQWNYPNNNNNNNNNYQTDRPSWENIPENNYPSDRDSSNQDNNQYDKSQWESPNEEKNPSDQSQWENTNEESNPTDKSHWDNTNEEKNPSDQSKWDYSNQYDKANDVESAITTTPIEWNLDRDDTTTTTPDSSLDDQQSGQNQDDNRDDTDQTQGNEGGDTQQDGKGHEHQQDKEGHEHHQDKEGHDQLQGKDGSEKQPGGNDSESSSSGGESNPDGETSSSSGDEGVIAPPKKGMNWLPIIIIAASIAVLLIIGLGFLFLRKKRGNKGYGPTATSDQPAGGTTARA